MWEESKHPRNEQGEFTEKNGGGLSKDDAMVELDKLKNQLSNLKVSRFAPSDERDKIVNRMNELREIIKSNKPSVVKKPVNDELKEDYMMSHRPTESGITADNLANQDVESPMPIDIYDKWDKYFNKNDISVVESINALKKIKDNPNGEITIYRATIGDSINDGDWVTLSKSYADKHNDSSLKGKGKVLKMVVSAKDIQYAGDSINEWGYFPKQDNEREQASKLFNIKL